MKQYLISEEELIELIYKFVDYYEYHHKGSGECATKDFLKSKKPVEEIVDRRGKIKQAINWDLDIGETKYKIFIQKEG